MVGVPRSTGCQLCRARKVKCDEARPACGNCIKYGVQCPGYDRSRKFVVGKHQIRQRGKRADNVVKPASCAADSNTTLSCRLGPLVRAPLTLARSLQLPRAQVLYNMIESSYMISAATDIYSILSWVAVDRLGKRALLDGAVCSFALHLAGKQTSDSELIAQSRSIYVLTLNELQAALRHPSEWSAPETLCAAILLCFFELFAGTTAPDTWLQHAKGIGILMEQRGPTAHAEGWDAAMLLSFRGILIMSDMFYPGKDQFFLLRPAWHQVMFDRGRHLIHPAEIPDETIRVADAFFTNLVQVSPVLRWGYLVREANKAGISVEPSQLSSLAHLAAANHASFSQWYDEFAALPIPQPIEAAPIDPASSLYETVLVYEHQSAGAMHMGYWASMLILQETLAQCGMPVPNSEASQRDLVEKILRSVESVGQGTMGPYRVGFSIRIAYEFSSAEEQRWIRSILDQFSRSYAAVDKKSYPAPKADTDGYSVRGTIESESSGVSDC
ncbi:hypothetical protein LRP88_09737 [Fusarium phalaenopsidis]|nr:Zn(2)-C6 fungal-type domain-containing protein [Fusarium sp. Ph1]